MKVGLVYFKSPLKWYIILFQATTVFTLREGYGLLNQLRFRHEKMNYSVSIYTVYDDHTTKVQVDNIKRGQYLVYNNAFYSGCIVLKFWEFFAHSWISSWPAAGRQIFWLSWFMSMNVCMQSGISKRVLIANLIKRFANIACVFLDQSL